MMQIIDNIPVWGSPVDEGALSQIRTCARTADQSLYSTVHGAGRVMGRLEAKVKRDKRGGWKRAPKVTAEMMSEWVEREHVEPRGAGCDESPHCYKRLPDVLAEHAGTIRILHTLRPIG